jgi:epoxyqueuosine reductase QueG
VWNCFQQVGISDLNLQQDEQYLNEWLASHYHGQMDYGKTVANAAIG